MSYQERVNVVLEVEEVDSDNYRVHMIGVFREGEATPPLRYQHRNVVQTWLGVDHDVSSFLLGKGE